MLRKKILVFLVITSMLSVLLPATVALANPIVTITPSNVTHNSATINVSIHMGNENTAAQNGALLYFSSEPNPFVSTMPRLLSITGANTFSESNLEPNHKYYCGVKIDYQDENGDYQTVYEVQEFTTTAAPAPTAPTGVAIVGNASSITTTTAVITLNVTSAGENLTNYRRGVVYSTSSNPTIANSIATASGQTGETTVSLSGLNPNTQYYVRAFAENGGLLAYSSNQINFTTTSTGQIPTVTTGNITNIRTDRADIRINVTNQGSSNVTERGIVFSTNTTRPDVTSSTKRTASGSGTGQSTVSLTGLSRNTRYYVWAYAINSQGTAFGARVEFRTLSSDSGAGNTPDAVTTRVEDVTANTAEIRINIRSGSDITERGVVYSSSNEDPERSGSRNHTQKTFGTTGEAVVMLQDLSRNTKYYARAYATNRHGTSYGDVVEFTTDSNEFIPNVITVSAEAKSSESMEVRIDVRRDNGSNITERGVVYSRTDVNPKVGARSSDEETISGRTGTGTVSVTGLSRNQTYYVRAYAINRDGTAYGAVMEVRLGGSNLVVTNKVTNITGTTATAGGVAAHLSDVEIREYGVVYSTTNKLPTASDTTVRGNNIDFGDFSVNLTGLTSNQTYYLRAFIRTNSGYEYGGVEEFTTTGNATLTLQYRLPDGSQVGSQSLVMSAGRVITSADLQPPQGFTLVEPHLTYTMPGTNDTIAVIVRFGGAYQVMQPTRAAGTEVRAQLSSNTLLVSGQTTVFPAVNIDDYNWLKLRDIAMILNNTSKQFEVGFDSARNTGSITSGRRYTPVGQELSNTLGSNPVAVATPQRLIMDGNEISIAAYNIDGYNYFRLRDIAILRDFNLGYDSASGVITLLLDKPYSE